MTSLQFIFLVFTWYLFSFFIGILITFLYMGIYNHGQVREIKKRNFPDRGAHLCAHKSHEIDISLSLSFIYFSLHSFSFSLSLTPFTFYLFLKIQTEIILTLILIIITSKFIIHLLTVIIINFVRAICVRRCF